ncbi:MULTISPECIES: MFS transporter [unclassified Beijerinckia]|uniref:MFS transporter n=1 Tax=unclassified Beijerinckia TaxID=2638183 RepID=UPI00089D7AA7|nr:MULTISPECIES: MFS transporter [unclassified Beijerinckia]MDH7794235.1 AAHS family 4-hydroxybenzoate transporter-like MFS transporter [Beijerinckia sp. GAS462]SEB56471.1 MFS transporter, AAHS family, 4-hydroxybenzoate transporter [Beijerinckia sp. 28-YEA-48]
MRETADLDEVIDSAPFGAFQISVVALCAIVAMIDGFDTQVIGMVAPAIAAEWNVYPTLFGPVFSSGLFGGMIGALMMGQAGDRWGRKPVLIAAILLFSLGSLATCLTQNVTELMIVRLITGLGLGGALPIIISIASEFSPKRHRTNIVAFMFCGFPLGSAIGGIISAKIIPLLGWKSLFWGGGLFPLLLLPFFLFFVPESARFLALRGKRDAVRRIFERMGSALTWSGATQSGAQEQSASVFTLFRQGRAWMTALMWATLFLSLLLTVFLASWLPLLAREAGLGMEAAVLAITSLNVGGIIGGFVIGRLCDRTASAKPIAAAYVLGAVAISLIGMIGHSNLGLLVITFLAGLFTVGAQMCAIALSSHLYETSIRSTGVGWAFGIGRVGAVVGPIAGGILIGMQISIQALFLVAAAVALGSALAVLTIKPRLARANAAQPIG